MSPPTIGPGYDRQEMTPSQWQTFPTSILKGSPKGDEPSATDLKGGDVRADLAELHAEIDSFQSSESLIVATASASPIRGPDIAEHPSLRPLLQSPILSTIREDPTAESNAEFELPYIRSPGQRSQQSVLKEESKPPKGLQPAPISKSSITMKERIWELTKENGKLNQVLEAKIEIIHKLSEQNAALQESLRCQIAVKNGTLRALSNTFNRRQKDRPQSVTSVSESASVPRGQSRRSAEQTKPGDGNIGKAVLQRSKSERGIRRRLTKRKSKDLFRSRSRENSTSRRSDESDEPHDFDATKKSWLNLGSAKSVIR